MGPLKLHLSKNVHKQAVSSWLLLKKTSATSEYLCVCMCGQFGKAAVSTKKKKVQKSHQIAKKSLSSLHPYKTVRLPPFTMLRCNRTRVCFLGDPQNVWVSFWFPFVYPTPRPPPEAEGPPLATEPGLCEARACQVARLCHRTPGSRSRARIGGWDSISFILGPSKRKNGFTGWGGLRWLGVIWGGLGWVVGWGGLGWCIT